MGTWNGWDLSRSIQLQFLDQPDFLPEFGPSDKEERQQETLVELKIKQQPEFFQRFRVIDRVRLVDEEGR